MMQPNIEDMHPELFKRWIVHKALMEKRGLKFALNAVLRTQEMQLAYAAQGRPIDALIALLLRCNWMGSASRIREMAKEMPPIVICNVLRAEAGMAKIGPADWYIVTKTMYSRHFPDKNGKSRAYDIKILKDGQIPTWDEKFDGDGDKIPDYAEAATAGQEAGLVAGAFFTGFRDWPHFELPANIT